MPIIVLWIVVLFGEGGSDRGLFDQKFDSSPAVLPPSDDDDFIEPRKSRHHQNHKNTFLL